MAFLETSTRAAWVLYLIALPVTSLPFVSALAGHVLVAPASLVPLGWLSLWLAVYLLKVGRIPHESVPLFFFSSLAVVSSAAAFFLSIPPFKSKTILGEETSALATLAIGVLFYLVTASWLLQKPTQLTGTLRWISLGGAIAILWAIVQAVYIFLYDGHFPGFLVVFHRFFSIRDFSLKRITAFAYEPSWLAHQMNVLYLPLWLAATLQGWSAFPRRLGKWSLENTLLGAGSIIVLLSSRIGALSFLLILLVLVVHYSGILVRRVQSWLLSFFTLSSLQGKRFLPLLLGIVLTGSLLCLYLALGLTILYGISKVDPRLERLFQLPAWLPQQSTSLNAYTVFRYLAFAERYVYWVAGWRIFARYPLFGVGLGNAGFFFPIELPAYSWNLPEITDYLYRSSFLPNVKSFWVRLLAETGIVGFASFLAWYYVMWTSACGLRRAAEPLHRVIGWAGLFVLVAFLTEGFSVDTFALPYLWVSLGMVSAAAAIARREKCDRINSPEASP